MAVEVEDIYEALSEAAAERKKAGAIKGGETAGKGRPKKDSLPQLIGEGLGRHDTETDAVLAEIGIDKKHDDLSV